jgi:hypothetical protein
MLACHESITNFGTITVCLFALLLTYLFVWCPAYLHVLFLSYSPDCLLSR